MSIPDMHFISKICLSIISIAYNIVWIYIILHTTRYWVAISHLQVAGQSALMYIAHTYVCINHRVQYLNSFLARWSLASSHTIPRALHQKVLELSTNIWMAYKVYCTHQIYIRAYTRVHKICVQEYLFDLNFSKVSAPVCLRIIIQKIQSEYSNKVYFQKDRYIFISYPMRKNNKNHLKCMNTS